MKNKTGYISRLLLIISATGLVFVLFQPIWKIDLDAPQYPEGLSLKIYANDLKGNVDIINGLNHYIGMKTLHKSDFVEFTVLPYCIIFFVAAFMLVAIAGRRKWLNILLCLFVLFGIIAIADFWRWEYNYGHNLDPNAAIIVPGMAYQPPLIGFKQLLNFGAYSMPDIGGWIFIGAGVLLLSAALIEWRKVRDFRKRNILLQPALLFFIPLFLNSCKNGPDAIETGKDNCYFCKMTITDPRYGAELITNKGKAYKFDDIHCIVNFIRSGMIDRKNIKDVYLVDFAGDHSLMKSAEGFLLQGDAVHGPMNGNVIAFSNKDSMKENMVRLNANPVNWEQLVK